MGAGAAWPRGCWGGAGPGAGDTGDSGGSSEAASGTFDYPPNRGFLGDPVDKTLQPGTRIDRYGFEGGRFASPEGVPAPMRSSPPGTIDKPYNVYEVIEPLDVKEGTAAPWCEEPGLGTQYELPASVADLIDQGIIRRIQ